jgi:NIMA (never in mitosis gene a)-related kinase
VREVGTDAEWVIKQINLADLSPDEQETAEKEAKILQLLDHQNIVRFKEVYRTAKQKLNIVMEYAAGGDLSHRIRTAKDSSSPLPEEQILDWFIQICLGVKHIHDRYCSPTQKDHPPRHQGAEHLPHPRWHG